MSKYEAARAAWKSRPMATEADIDLALDNFRILFAYHSGKIENEDVTYHDTREIFENGKVVGYTGSTRAIFEQQNQKLCYEYLKAKIAAKEPLSVGLILEVHSILTSGTYDERRFLDKGERPGAFKRHDYVTGRLEVGCPPEEVAGELEALVEEMNAYSGNSPLKAAAYLHLRFEYIHPFADGNGRVGRTLVNYFLMTHDEPPLIIYDEDKAAYYAALERYDADEEIEPMVQFLRAETERTWEKSLERGHEPGPTRKRLQEHGSR